VTSLPSNPSDPLENWTVHALVGPTSIGKTELALSIAEHAGAEVLSLDSMLVYRGLDIGTAKATATERARVPHHLIDLVNPDETYDVQRYLADVRTATTDLRNRDKPAFFVGGTGLYLAALVRGLFEGPPVDRELRAALEQRARTEGNAALHAELVRTDPNAAERIHVNDTKRLVRALEVHEQTGRTLSDWQREWGAASPERPSRLVGLELAVPELDRRIRERTGRMLDAGWADEAAAVRAGAGFSPTSIQALGYSEVLALHDGEIDRTTCEERIALRTRQFARRQRTWFRKFPSIVWLDASRDLTQLRAEALQALGWAGSSRSG
jgi:tRNA dimethylallyltransferase